MGFTISLRVVDMVGVVRVVVVCGRLDGSWAVCVRWDGLGAVSEGSGGYTDRVEVFGWVLDWVECVAVVESCGK